MKKVIILSSIGGCVGLAYRTALALQSINEPIQVFVETAIPKAKEAFCELGEIITFLEEKPQQKRGVIPTNFYKKFNRKK